jgi:hypothetical protein
MRLIIVLKSYHLGHRNPGLFSKASRVVLALADEGKEVKDESPGGEQSDPTSKSSNDARLR